MMKLRKCIAVMATMAVLSFAIVGCGSVNSATDSKGNGNNQSVSEDADNAADDVGDAVDDVAQGVGDAVEDVGDAAADLIDGSNGFDDYDKAHDYFLQEMGFNDQNASYEVRDEKRDIVTYNGTEEGYRFELYDTANGAEGVHKGTYYVDKKNGKIYQKQDGKDKVKEVVINHGNTDTK